MSIDTDALSDALNKFSSFVHDFASAVVDVFLSLSRLIKNVLVDIWHRLDPRHDQDKYALFKAELLAQLKEQLQGQRAELAFEACDITTIAIMNSTYPVYLADYEILVRLVKVFLAFDGDQRYSFNGIVEKIKKVETYIDLLSLEVEAYDLGEKEQ